MFQKQEARLAATGLQERCDSAPELWGVAGVMNACRASSKPGRVRRVPKKKPGREDAPGIANAAAGGLVTSFKEPGLKDFNRRLNCPRSSIV